MKVFLSIVTLLIVAPLLVFGLYYLAYQTDAGIVDEDKVVIEKLKDALASSISTKAVKIFSDEWSYICFAPPYTRTLEIISNDLGIEQSSLSVEHGRAGYNVEEEWAIAFVTKSNKVRINAIQTRKFRYRSGGENHCQNRDSAVIKFVAEGQGLALVKD
jgi:hypothetical protein